MRQTSTHLQATSSEKLTSHQAEQVCFHCYEPIPAFTNITAVVAGKQQPMCCMGCKAITEFIEHQGLSQFYQHRERLDGQDFFGQISQQQLNVEKWSFLDDKELSKDYIVTKNSDHREITIFVKDLYCSSCSWLINKALQSETQRIQVHIDITTKRVVLSIDDPVISIAKLIGIIAQLGYEPLIAKVGDIKAIEIEAKREQDRSMKRIAVAAFGMMQVMTYAIATYFGMTSDMQVEHYRFMTLISMLIATVVVFYSGKPFFDNAINDLKNSHFGMDVPIALAISVAYFPSVIQTLSRSNEHVYFDSAVMFIFLLLLGRHLEIRARHKLSGSNSDVQSLLPQAVVINRLQETTRIRQTIKPNEVEVGDRLQLSTDDVIVFDGKLISGRLLVDESVTSGESLPIVKGVGDTLIAGSKVINGDGLIEAKNNWLDSSIAKIEQKIQSAIKSEQFELRTNQAISRYFIAGVMVLTLAVTSFWMFYQSDRAFEIALAMLIAACPCAFSLAAPIARSAATHALRTVGILLTNNQVLKHLPDISTWYFDKTGTLTRGEPEIETIETVGSMSSGECIHLIAAMVKQNEHVFSKAFNHIESQLYITDIKEVAGQGLSGSYVNKQYFVGKKEWICQNISAYSASCRKLAQFNNQRQTSEMWLASQDEVLAVIFIKDQLRPSAPALLASLKETGNCSIVLSGDKHAAVRTICRGLAIDSFVSGLLPEDKQNIIRNKQRSGQKVIMVGDGVNDAPALAQSDISIVMASGSELSQNNADVILINGNLNHLDLLKGVANKTRQITKQNKYWAIFYNATILPLAALGLLTPWIAAIGMSTSSLLVMLNSLRISRTVAIEKRKKTYSTKIGGKHGNHVRINTA